MKHKTMENLYTSLPNTSYVQIRAYSRRLCAKCRGIIEAREKYVRVVHGEKDADGVMRYRRVRFHVECWKEKSVSIRQDMEEAFGSTDDMYSSDYVHESEFITVTG